MISYTPPTPRRRWPLYLLVVIIVLAFIFAISACGSADASTPASPSPAPTAEVKHADRIDMGEGSEDVKVTCFVNRIDEYRNEYFLVFTTAREMGGSQEGSTVSVVPTFKC